MNLISGCFKCVPTTFTTALQLSRNYAKQYQLPINWIMPVKASAISKEKSGDRGIDLNITPDCYMPGFEKSKELQDADELVKKMFTLGFNSKCYTGNLLREKAMKLVQYHRLDKRSFPCRIAKLTVEILSMQEYMANSPHDTRTKHKLKEKIEKRNKYLKVMRTKDYGCYEYLLEKLNLIYRPFPEEYPSLIRRISMKMLLKDKCDEIVKKKLEDYKQELQSQQKDFYTEKVEKLKFIRNEEIACGVEPTVSEEEIEAAEQKAASFV